MLKDWLMNTASPLWLLAGENGSGDGAPGASELPEGDAATKDGAPPAGEGNGAASGAEGAAAAGGGGEAPGEGAEGGDGASGEEERPPGVTAKDWRDRQISRQHRKLADKEREAAELRQQLADAQALLERHNGGQPPAGTAVAPAARPDIPAAVEAAAERIVSQRDYDSQCNAAFNSGKKEYGAKWNEALDRLTQLGGVDGATMTGILATDDPAKVLYTLGSNPDEYERVMDLPPARRLAEFVKIGIKTVPKPKPKPSKAPAPVEGIERRAVANNDEAKLYDPKTNDEDWYKIRAAQKATRFAAKQGQRRPA